MAGYNNNNTPALKGDLLRYEPETGFLFWLANPRKHKNGKRADIAGSRGYRIVCHEWKQYGAHRVAWFLAHGEWPEILDHVNGDRSDNRLANLRKATHYTNNQNIRLAKANSKTGILGVESKKDGQFAARIRANDTLVYLGLFTTIEAAHTAYLQAKRKLHAGCTI